MMRFVRFSAKGFLLTTDFTDYNGFLRVEMIRAET